jgi:hypothetical protein
MNRARALRPGNVLTHIIDGETVILNLDNEKYFTLDAVATRFWEVVLEKGVGDEALEVLLAEYEVERHVLASDMERWLEEAVSLGLLLPDESG